MGLFFSRVTGTTTMALPGPVIFKKFQMVPEIIKFSLFGFSSKLESEMTKKIYESCPWKKRLR